MPGNDKIPCGKRWRAWMVAVLRGEMRGWKRKGPSLNPLCVSRWPKEVFLPLSSMKSGDERGAAALSDRKTRVRTREMYLIALYQRRWPRRVYRDRAALSFHEGWPVLLPCPLRFTIIIEVYPILRTCWTIANGIRDKGFRNDFVINRNFFRPSARRCCVFFGWSFINILPLFYFSSLRAAKYWIFWKIVI